MLKVQNKGARWRGLFLKLKPSEVQLSVSCLFGLVSVRSEGHGIRITLPRVSVEHLGRVLVGSACWVSSSLSGLPGPV